MDWVAGGLTLLSLELVARRKWQGWLVGLLNQGFWLALILSRELWGLLPLTLLLTWRFAVALVDWRRAETLSTVVPQAAKH